MKIRNYCVAVLIVISAGSLLADGCTSPNHRQSVPAGQSAGRETPDSPVIVSLSPEQYRHAGLKFGNMERRKLNTSLQVNGLVNVSPQNKISVTFPYGGFVRNIYVLEGNYVRQGALLAVLENPEYVDLQENYLKNKSSLEYAFQEYRRQKELYQSDVAAGKTYQKAKSDYESLQASVKALAQKLNMLGIPAETLTPDNIRSVVNVAAPQSGYITKVLVNRGKYIQPQEELLELDNTKDAHIDLTVYEKDIGSIQPGQVVRFRPAGDNQPEQKARIILVGSEIKPDRSVVVHAIPETKGQRFLPGTYVRAYIDQSNSLSDALPEEAVVRSGGQPYIFMKEDNRSFQFRMIPVKTGVANNGYLQVTLPEKMALKDSSIVIKGAFVLLSVLKNTGED